MCVYVCVRIEARDRGTVQGSCGITFLNWFTRSLTSFLRCVKSKGETYLQLSLEIESSMCQVARKQFIYTYIVKKEPSPRAGQTTCV